MHHPEVQAPTVAFVCNRHNLNSIAALTGALETDPRTKDLSLRFLWEDERLEHRLRELAGQVHRPVVALSFSTADLPRVSDSLALLATLDPPPFVIAGGPHPSARPEAVLRLGAQAVVVGEGEAALPTLVERLQAGGSPVGLPGVVTLGEDGHPIRGLRPRPVDLDEIPPMGIVHRRFAPVEITRGCPCACSFCQTTFLFGGRMRHRSVERLMFWLRSAMAQGYSYLRFVTPNALAYQSEDNGRSANLDAIERLLRASAALFGRDRVYFGTFPSEVGPELVSAEAVALIRRYCANDNLILGAQSGSDTLLHALRRRHTVADVYRATETIAAAGLTPVVDIIFGLPGETASDLAATVQVVEHLVEMGAMIRSHTFMPLPGTPLEHEPPGVVDPALHAWLDRLASRGQQIGQWRKQARIAAS